MIYKNIVVAVWKTKTRWPDTLLAFLTTGGRHESPNGIRWKENDHSVAFQGDGGAYVEEMTGRDLRQAGSG